jgi:hypothetical protein
MLRCTKTLAPEPTWTALSHCFISVVWLGDWAPYLRRKANLNNRIKKQDLVRA